MTDPAFLLPRVDDDSDGFWAGCVLGELRVQTCSWCGRRRMPPRPMCPWCRSLESTWEPTDGRGTIWSFVVSHPPLLPAYAAEAPYNVIVVALDEDRSIRFVGNLVASPDGSIGEIDAASIEIGEPVRVCFGSEVDGIAVPRWMRP